jgi:hypothetical protein
VPPRTSRFRNWLRNAPALALVAGAFVSPAGAADWRVDADRSTFAVLTHRAGLASGLAHDHLVVARGATVTVAFDPAAPESAQLAFSAPVLSLDVDPSAERGRLGPRLRELGALDRDLPAVEEDDRAKVRKAMLAPGQLHVERYPRVEAALAGLERRGGEGARVALGWNARVRVTVHGKTVEKAVPARWEVQDGTLTAEALGEFRFTEFGIEPYSAMLGAVQNADAFHVYVSLVAKAP